MSWFGDLFSNKKEESKVDQIKNNYDSNRTKRIKELTQKYEDKFRKLDSIANSVDDGWASTNRWTNKNTKDYIDIIKKIQEQKKSHDKWRYQYEQQIREPEIVISKKQKQLLDEYEQIQKDIQEDEIIKDAWEKFLMFRKLRKS